MADIPINTTAEKFVPITVTIEKLEADLICFDDVKKRLAISVNYIDTDVIPEEKIRTQLVIISGATYISLVTGAVNGSLTFAQNLIAGVEMVLTQLVNGSIPTSDYKIVNINLFEMLEGNAGE